MPQARPQVDGVLVQIMDEEYCIATQRDVGEVQRIAAYVDRRMREIAAQRVRRVPRTTLAVLAAMEIASELLGSLAEQERLAATARENLDRLQRLVDARAAIPARLLGRDSGAARGGVAESPARPASS